MSTDKPTQNNDEDEEEDNNRWRTIGIGILALLLLAALATMLLAPAESDEPAPTPPPEAPPEQPEEPTEPVETAWCGFNVNDLDDPGETSYEGTTSTEISNSIATELNELRTQNNASELEVNEHASALARTNNQQGFAPTPDCTVEYTNPLSAPIGDRSAEDHAQSYVSFTEERNDALMQENWDYIGVGTVIDENGDVTYSIVLVEE